MSRRKAREELPPLRITKVELHEPEHSRPFWSANVTAGGETIHVTNALGPWLWERPGGVLTTLKGPLCKELDAKVKLAAAALADSGAAPDV